MAETGPTPPQRDPQQRDIAQRDASFNSFQQYERDNLAGGDDMADEIQQRDQEFFQPNRYDPNIPHEAADATFSERGRLQEVSGPYIDQMLEKYTGKVAQVENGRIERKTGGNGILGRMRNWMGSTVVGGRVNYAAKVTLGALCHAGTVAAPMFAPALHYAGNRLIADGLAQAAQTEVWERPVLERLERLRLGRHIWVREMQNIRNETTSTNPTTGEYIRRPVGDTLGNVPAFNPRESAAVNEAAGVDVANEFITSNQLNRRLAIIIEQLDTIDVQIHQEEERLAQIRSVGKGVRTGIGMAVSAANIYQLFHGGLSMGVQDFDKLGGAHDVLMTGTGVKFAYHAGEVMGNGLLAHGGELHGLGSVAPWGQIGASAASFVGAMIGSTAHDIGETGRLNQVYETERANLPENQAVFSFRDRQTSGISSGANTEIEDNMTVHSQRTRELLNERKNQMGVGTICRINDTGTPPGLPPTMPVPGNVRRSGGQPLIQIVRWEDQQGLTFAFVTDDPDPELDSSGLLIENRYTLTNADSILENGHKEADDLKSTTSEGRIDKYLEGRSENLEAPQQREVSDDILLSLTRTIPSGHFVDISRPPSAKGQIVIKEFSDGSGTQTGATITLDPATSTGWEAQLNAIFDNSGKIDDRKEFVEKKVDKVIEDKGEDLKANPFRRLTAAPTISGHHFVSGNFVKIDRSATSPDQIVIQEYSDATTREGGPVTLNHLNAATEFSSIIDNSEKIKNLQEGVEKREKEKNDAMLKEINQILHRHAPSNREINSKTKSQLFQINSTDEWVAVTAVDDTVPNGRIEIMTGMGLTAILAEPNPKNRKTLTDAAVMASSNEEFTFESFRDHLNAGAPPTSYTNRFQEQAVKI